MDSSTQLANFLLEIEAIKLRPSEPYTWASGIRSPIYCDNRLSLSHPKVRNFVKELLIFNSKEFGNFDAVVGVATAGIPHGMMLADALGLPFAYVRSKSKQHGRQNQIEGKLSPNDKVLVIEDLISTGMSSLAAIEALQKAGVEVIGTLAIFTYGFNKSKQAFKTANIKLSTLCNYDILIDAALKTNSISQNEKEILTDWKSNPESWYDQHFSTKE